MKLRWIWLLAVAGCGQRAGGPTPVVATPGPDVPAGPGAVCTVGAPHDNTEAATTRGLVRGEAVGSTVVSANYRLGALGFLAHPALSAEDPRGASGNYGLYDSLAALAWLRDNVAAFGGDPDRVMVFGESAGAINTCMLVASPLGKG